MKRKIRFDRIIIILTIISIISLSCFKLGSNLNNRCLESNVILDEIIVEVKADEIVEEDIITSEPKFIGVYKLTGYCACSICCGHWADGITAVGTEATEGRTIAVDPNKIPLGSKVLINGQIYIAEDTGSAIKENRIDIYKDSHSDCFSKDCNGYAEVYLLVE